MNRTEKIMLLKGIQAGIININALAKVKQLNVCVGQSEDETFMIDNKFVSHERFTLEQKRQILLHGPHKFEVICCEECI